MCALGFDWINHVTPKPKSVSWPNKSDSWHFYFLNGSGSFQHREVSGCWCHSAAAGVCLFEDWNILKPSTCGSLENNETCNAISLLEKNQNKRLFSLFNSHFWAIATAEACKGEAKLSSTLWIVAMSHMSMICFCYVLLVSNMFDRKSTWTDDCWIISPRVSCFFQKLVAQPPELSQLRSSLTKGRLTKGAALPWAFSPREFPWWRSIGGPWMPVQCDARRHGMVGHFSIEFP